MKNVFAISATNVFEDKENSVYSIDTEHQQGLII
jgi:hypothetical protein